ncbi:phosphatase PAP2 family protein [Baekduia sp. Peel2402]|uniref:phosphatase PAP2 family protein n=1 Tax=Baekduia sp. Peel2402 TaxID=3458296 RepID=UPI00403ECF84
MDAGSLFAADVALYRAARTRGHSPQAEHVVRAFSRTGEHAALWLAIGGLGMALDRPRRAQWRRGVKATTAAYVLNTAIKQVVRRRRPALADLPQLMKTPTQLSFPSAHASSSFAGARAFSPLVAGGRGGKVLYPLALAMAASRVYLGVHYPSDILAGALLGTFVGDRAR